ncbi:glycopolymer--peptidoglycan transferase LytR [Streptococcus dentiloxodontae]
MKIGKKILLMLLAILGTTVVAVGIYVGTTYSYATGVLSKTHKSSNALSGDANAIKQTKPITILLMGVDTGSATRTDTWEGNSDTMLLVTVNPQTKKATMTSLERDLLTTIDGYGQAKLNAAYADGGADLAIKTIQNVLDIDINYYALINMQGLIDLVDAVGGIEVTNNFDFAISIADNEPEYTATIEPGTHTINGEQALVYSRMRYDDPEGDYGRQKRQREVIEKVVSKLLNMDSISSYKSILSSISSNVQTSIDLSDTSTLQSLMGYGDAMKNLKSYQLAGSDATIDGASYQVATTENILEVQNRIKKEIGEEEVTENTLKTSLVLYETVGASSYDSGYGYSESYGNSYSDSYGNGYSDAYGTGGYSDGTTGGYDTGTGGSTTYDTGGYAY